MNEPASFPPINRQNIRHHQMTIEWRTTEHDHLPRSSDWYWIVGIVAVALAVLALFFNNGLFGLIILLGTGTMLIYSAKPPAEILVTINAKGVRVNDRLYPFTNIKSFNIKEHWHGPVLILNVNKAILPLVVLPINEENVDVPILHQYLEAFAPEAPHNIPLAELIAESLGF